MFVRDAPTRFGSSAAPARTLFDSLAVRLARILVVLAGAFLAQSAGALAGESASAARSLRLSEIGHLNLTSHHGFTLNEKGSASGTIRGTIYIHLNVVSTNRVTAEVNIYPNGGSLTGIAKADYRVAGATATFTGSMTVARGTGTYRRARGTGLVFSGTIQRSNDAVTVRLSGQMSD